MLTSFPHGGVAVVIGATGGIGAAVLDVLNTEACFSQVLGFSRGSVPPLDVLDEDSIAHCARAIAATGLPLRLLVDATGMLSSPLGPPEKSLQQLNPTAMAQAFAINAIGPALLMKHFLPLLPRDGKSVFATLSAKVGSIGDNHLGGWYSYRASKAALNQLVHTAAIEVRRRQPHAICVSLHPGTVDTALSQPFAKAGLNVVTAEDAAKRLLSVIDNLTADSSGGFFNHDGNTLPW